MCEVAHILKSFNANCTVHVRAKVASRIVQDLAQYIYYKQVCATSGYRVISSVKNLCKEPGGYVAGDVARVAGHNVMHLRSLGRATASYPPPIGANSKLIPPENPVQDLVTPLAHYLQLPPPSLWRRRRRRRSFV